MSRRHRDDRRDRRLTLDSDSQYQAQRVNSEITLQKNKFGLPPHTFLQLKQRLIRDRQRRKEQRWYNSHMVREVRWQMHQENARRTYDRKLESLNRRLAQQTKLSARNRDRVIRFSERMKDVQWAFRREVCHKRAERRRVLFAKKKCGKGHGGPKDRKITLKSLVRC